MSKPTQPQVGAVAWTEIATSSPQESLAFYSSLFGWESQEMPGGGYFMMKNGEQEVAGIMDKSAHCDGPPMWISYVQVANLEESLAQVTELGGKIMMGSTPVEGRGIFAMVEDPQGGKFAIWEALQGEDC